MSISCPADRSQGLPSQIATAAASGLPPIPENPIPAADKQLIDKQLSAKPKFSPPVMQETLYNFLLDLVRKQPPEKVLLEFKYLFIAPANPNKSETRHTLHKIIFTEDPETFHNLLKRSCYILVNNWNATRQPHAIQSLLELFADQSIYQKTASIQLRRLRRRLQNFLDSQDFQDLKLFAGGYDYLNEGPWAQRYASYLLVSQYANSHNPVEQRQAALAASKQLKEKFKFDLAMYTARVQQTVPQAKPNENPTDLGDEAAQLIQELVKKRGFFNYQDLANIFLQQTQPLSYIDFKPSLLRYLLFSLDNKHMMAQLRKHFASTLNSLYPQYHQVRLNDTLLHRTCNRLIEALTTDRTGQPTLLFGLFIVQEQVLTLAILLLKLILICRQARTHLELCIAKLIQHYEDAPRESCEGLIRFLEVHNLVMTIHADDMNFNLLNMQNGHVNGHKPEPRTGRRIFSQRRADAS